MSARLEDITHKKERDEKCGNTKEKLGNGKENELIEGEQGLPPKTCLFGLRNFRQINFKKQQTQE